MELQYVSHLSSEGVGLGNLKVCHNPILKLKLNGNLDISIPNTLSLEM